MFVFVLVCACVCVCERERERERARVRPVTPRSAGGEGVVALRRHPRRGHPLLSRRAGASLYISLSLACALSQFIWAHQIGEPRFLAAPQLTNWYRNSRMSTCEDSIDKNEAELVSAPVPPICSRQATTPCVWSGRVLLQLVVNLACTAPMSRCSSVLHLKFLPP